LFTLQILLGAAVVLVPGNLITLIISTQVLEGVITPITLIMILIQGNRRSLLGAAANGPWARWLGGASITSVAAVSAVFVILTVLGWSERETTARRRSKRFYPHRKKPVY
jgi:Mn2+/Fe2+ NRAMP family transporter